MPTIEEIRAAHSWAKRPVFWTRYRNVGDCVGCLEAGEAAPAQFEVVELMKLDSTAIRLASGVELGDGAYLMFHARCVRCHHVRVFAIEPDRNADELPLFTQIAEAISHSFENRRAGSLISNRNDAIA
ncbi:MAG: hypothetical protein KAT00_00415 [Planctomycetes bacterium]|nr:hypothetical protein [Planctomycetota bacterium]MCK5641570.1 hypothetical protein [Gammaproteobacteria bacterium]